MQPTEHDMKPRPDARVTVRGAVAGDVPAIREFLAGLAGGSNPPRSFTQASEPRVAAYWATPDDATDHCGLVATIADRIVGHAAYVRLYGPRAELAVDLADRLDRAEIGARLVAGLGRVARENGITRFVAVGPVTSGGITYLFVAHPEVADEASGWSVVEFPIELVAGEDS
jgi:hypothetical protein